MFLLADGVAVVTTASGGWDAWTTPQGVGAISGLIVSALSVVALILGLLGKKDLQQRVQVAHDTIQDKNTQIQAAVDALRSVVQGIEAAKVGLDPDAKAHLVATIQAVATTTGAQSTLDPIVQAIQAGKTDLPGLLKTLTDTLGKLKAPAAT
jgi:gamma-glutamyl:cysteine ligase YbdK (ATP-grasp superfamily)